MTVTKLGIFIPSDMDRHAEPLLTEFRHFIDEPDEVDATFNIYPTLDGPEVIIRWELEMVGMGTFHRADSYEEAEAWVHEQIEPWCNSDYTVPDKEETP